MPPHSQAERWNAKVEAAFKARFGPAEWDYQHHLGLWKGHLGAGFANSDFVERLVKGSDEAFRQSVWEMLLGRHLRACGYQVTAPAENAPDFRLVDTGGSVIWVEAISPTPGPVLAPGGGRVSLPKGESSPPFDDMLLRWTAAFKEKAEKGEKYRNAGIIAPDEAYVIAIDACQLSAVPLTHGVSRKPFILEVVFGLGPVRLNIGPNDNILGLESTSRLVVYNRKNAPIPTEQFFNSSNVGISGLLSAYPRAYDKEELLEVQVAYNPLAAAPLQNAIFGGRAEEWRAVRVEDDGDAQVWELHCVSENDR